MSEHALAQTHTANTPQAVAKDSVFLQRREREQAEQSALQQWQIDTVSGTFIEPRFGYDFSRVPALTGMVRQNQPMLRAQQMVQRAPKDGAPDSSSCPTCAEAESECPNCAEAESEQTSATAEPTAEAATLAQEAAPIPVLSGPTEETADETATPGEVASPGLIVEDSATELSPGQMKKSEFLSQLQSEVCRTVDAALAGTGRTTDDCPYLSHWFDFYSGKESAHIERSIHRYAPEASNATTVRGYISAVSQRARQSAETWATTGEITGVPKGIAIGLPGTSLLGGLVSGIGSIFFKAREGGARDVDDPQVILAELGDGQPLDSGVRSRMESAFGMDFAHVRTHTDTTATGLSNRLNARAFTVGEHVAFGSGEYLPGTLIGDALIAHELAHVVQQSSGTESVAQKQGGDPTYNNLEDDADKSAVGAVALLWRDAKGASVNIAQDAIPRLRSGLKLQRCSPTQAAQAPTPSPAAVTCVPNRPLTWADFTGTPTGTFDAWTRYEHDLQAVQGKQVIRAVFDNSGSWAKDKVKHPTDRSKNGCGPIVTQCEQVFNNLPPGQSGTLPLAAPPATCAASTHPDTSLVATNSSQCSSVLGAECDRVRVAESPRILRHEQLHFKIGCVLAQKGTNALANNSNLNAQAVLNKVITESNRLSVGGPNNLYDVQTSHGCTAANQATWESDVQNGLPNVAIP